MHWFKKENNSQSVVFFNLCQKPFHIFLKKAQLKKESFIY
jgi:hypothetical protein